MSFAELQELVAQHNLPKFTAKQLVEWLYLKRVKTFDEMTNLSKATRQLLSENYTTGYRDFITVQESKDGTKKYLFPAENGFIEAAYIPERERATLCVSCQVGCKMNCQFCQTGKQGFQGNLSAGDIINQILNLPEDFYIPRIQLMPRAVDAVEIINANRKDFENELAAQYAKNYGLPAIAGSDNHHAGKQKRLAGIETDEPIRDDADFLRVLKTGAYTIFDTAKE